MWATATDNGNCVFNGSFRPVLTDGNAAVIAHVERDRVAVLRQHSGGPGTDEDLARFLEEHGEGKPVVEVGATHYRSLLRPAERELILEACGKSRKAQRRK